MRITIRAALAIAAVLFAGCRAPEPATVDYPGSSWGSVCPYAEVVMVEATSDVTGNHSLVWDCPDECPVHGLRTIGAATR